MVGPFSLYGMPLVLACIAARTHYVDITGEGPFVADVAQFNDQAREAGIYLVCCAGYDSVPSDLVNFLVNRRAAATGIANPRTPLPTVDTLDAAAAIAAAPKPKSLDAAVGNGAAAGVVKYVQALYNFRGGASRGTLETVAGILKFIRPSDHRALSLLTEQQRAALGGPNAIRVPFGFPSITGVRWCRPSNTYISPFMMAGVNQKIARKTSAMLGFYASYAEGSFGTFWENVSSWFVASVAPVLLYIPLLNRLIKWAVFPPLGEGPDAAARAKSKTTVVARGFDADPMKDVNAKELVRVTMRIPMDGYTFTAISAIETAQAIVDGELTAEAKEPGRFWSGGGAVTPAAVVGDALATRLWKSGAANFETRDKKIA
jgi:short subunit dehydrogenase-like uncharacterized protein